MSALPSTKAYFIRAMHEWCNDNDFTPHITVQVDENTVVPMEFVKDKQITLNVSYLSTGNLQMQNDMISFSARFGGVAREIWIPTGNVIAIFARENKVGMGFPFEKMPEKVAPNAANSSDAPRSSSADSAKNTHLKIVK